MSKNMKLNQIFFTITQTYLYQRTKTANIRDFILNVNAVNMGKIGCLNGLCDEKYYYVVFFINI